MTSTSCEIFRTPRTVAVHHIKLPWQKPPLSLNDRGASRGAVYAKASTTANVRQTVMLLARNLEIPAGCEYLRAQLHYLPENNQRRDSDNLAATAKAVYDALAGGTRSHPGLGLVEDDTPRFMGKPEPIIWPHRKGDQAAMWLVLSWFEGSPCPWHVGCGVRPAVP